VLTSFAAGRRTAGAVGRPAVSNPAFHLARTGDERGGKCLVISFMHHILMQLRVICGGQAGLGLEGTAIAAKAPRDDAQGFSMAVISCIA